MQRHRASQSQPKSAVRQQPYKRALVGSVELTFSSFPISHLHFVSLLAVSDDELDADGDKRSLFYRDARRRTFHALHLRLPWLHQLFPDFFFASPPLCSLSSSLSLRRHGRRYPSSTCVKAVDSSTSVSSDTQVRESTLGIHLSKVFSDLSMYFHFIILLYKADLSYSQHFTTEHDLLAPADRNANPTPNRSRSFRPLGSVRYLRGLIPPLRHNSHGHHVTPCVPRYTHRLGNRYGPVGHRAQPHS